MIKILMFLDFLNFKQVSYIEKVYKIIDLHRIEEVVECCLHVLTLINSTTL